MIEHYTSYTDIDRIIFLIKEKNKLLTDDILSGYLKKTRRTLITLSLISIVIIMTDSFPSRIENLGITINKGSEIVISWALIAALFFYLLAFIPLGWRSISAFYKDFYIIKVNFSSTSISAWQRYLGEKDEESKKELYKYIEKHGFLRRDRFLLWFRIIGDYIVPVMLGGVAIFLLVKYIFNN